MQIQSKFLFNAGFLIIFVENLINEPSNRKVLDTYTKKWINFYLSFS